GRQLPPGPAAHLRSILAGAADGKQRTGVRVLGGSGGGGCDASGAVASAVVAGCRPKHGSCTACAVGPAATHPPGAATWEINGSVGREAPGWESRSDGGVYGGSLRGSGVGAAGNCSGARVAGCLGSGVGDGNEHSDGVRGGDDWLLGADGS
ncbi:hypothetical protein EV177_011046, partial [Coemansia sp. RSA 1804]